MKNLLGFAIIVIVATLGGLSILVWAAGLTVAMSLSFGIVAWIVGAPLYYEPAFTIFYWSVCLWFAGFIALMALSFAAADRF